MSFAVDQPEITINPVASLSLLERAILAGAPNSHMRFILDVIQSNRSPASYSSAEMARITGKTENTATNIRRFVEEHHLFEGLTKGEGLPEKEDPQKISHDMYDNTSKPNISYHTHTQKIGRTDTPTPETPLSPPESNASRPPDTTEKYAFLLACEGLKKIGWGQKEGWQILDIATFVTQYGPMNVLYAQWMAQGPNVKNPAAVVTANIKYRGIQAPEGWLPPPLRVKTEKPQNMQTPVFTPDTPKKSALDSPPIHDTLTTRNKLVQHMQKNLRSGDERWFNQLHIDENSKDVLLLNAPEHFPPRLLDIYDRVLDRVCSEMGHTEWIIEFVEKGAPGSTA